MTAAPGAYAQILVLAGQTRSAVDTNLIIADGWPASLGPAMFGVGSDRPPPDSSGTEIQSTQEYVGQSPYKVDEEISIPCWIYYAAGGTDEASPRTKAYAAYSDFFTRIRADLTLGGALVDGNNYARIDSLTLEGPKSQQEASDGRYALLMFTVICGNRY